MAIKWSRNLATGIPTIDRQHMEYFNKVNDLLNIMPQNSKQVIHSTAGFLDEYVKYHFSTEEQAMQEYEYPFLEEHKKQHKVFLEKFNDARLRIDVDNIDEVYLEFDYLLVSWFMDHIRHVDQQLANFLKGKGLLI